MCAIIATSEESVKGQPAHVRDCVLFTPQTLTRSHPSRVTGLPENAPKQGYLLIKICPPGYMDKANDLG